MGTTFRSAETYRRGHRRLRRCGPRTTALRAGTPVLGMVSREPRKKPPFRRHRGITRAAIRRAALRATAGRPSIAPRRWGRGRDVTRRRESWSRPAAIPVAIRCHSVRHAAAPRARHEAAETRGTQGLRRVGVDTCDLHITATSEGAAAMEMVERESSRFPGERRGDVTAGRDASRRPDGSTEVSRPRVRTPTRM